MTAMAGAPTLPRGIWVGVIGSVPVTSGLCCPQIDQDGLTLPERTLYLAQDEESEKVGLAPPGVQGRPGAAGLGVPAEWGSVRLQVLAAYRVFVHGAPAPPAGRRARGAEGARDPAAGAAFGQREPDWALGGGGQIRAGSELGAEPPHNRSNMKQHPPPPAGLGYPQS